MTDSIIFGLWRIDGVFKFEYSSQTTSIDNTELLHPALKAN